MKEEIYICSSCLYEWSENIGGVCPKCFGTGVKYSIFKKMMNRYVDRITGVIKDMIPESKNDFTPEEWLGMDENNWVLVENNTNNFRYLEKLIIVKSGKKYVILEMIEDLALGNNISLEITRSSSLPKFENGSDIDLKSNNINYCFKGEFYED